MARRKKRKEKQVETTASTALAAPAAVTPASWRVVGTAVRGASHERGGLPCQDAQDFRLLPGGELLIAVADGAGSARYSDQGASMAVAEALNALEDRLRPGLPEDREGWQSLLMGAFSAARDAVLRLAEVEQAETDAQEVSPRDFACTLTCAVCAGGWLVVGQIGDGAVVVLDPGGAYATVTRVQRGEYANETHFLTQLDALDQLVTEVSDQPVKALAVMSDGLIRLALKMPSQQPHEPFFVPLIRFVESVEDAPAAARQLTEFLSSERVNARTDDDKSLVLAVRTLPAGEPEPAAQEPAAVDEETAPSLDGTEES